MNGAQKLFRHILIANNQAGERTATHGQKTIWVNPRWSLELYYIYCRWRNLTKHLKQDWPSFFFSYHVKYFGTKSILAVKALYE